MVIVEKKGKLRRRRSRRRRRRITPRSTPLKPRTRGNGFGATRGPESGESRPSSKIALHIKRDPPRLLLPLVMLSLLVRNDVIERLKREVER